ncbi:DUF3859 domain-containing protein [Phormidesmis priestleyi ULC007]|uniref:DUF3859 domain-containing protein n=1 Tax=Phormidesmis priestleyi ULC007 TaxID=1920490 RepID=A0A2T1DI68_9CYAN|nr:hypothetical protein [Phormidesmis priestleyi]PSB20188.1 DUF3859 domain-containing protein [Phormidesmis priestleyi ULC007]
MDTRITQTQLAQVVAEVGQSKQRDKELSLQVKQVLQELNLPDDLLDDALVQLTRRKALARQQKRIWLIGSAIATTLIGATAAAMIFHQQYQQEIARIAVTQNRVTLTKNSQTNIGEIDRQKNSQVFYQVTLKDVPLGDRLGLTCDWINPTGQVVQQSNYQTQPIEKSSWTTNCFYRLDRRSAVGVWQVQMSLEGRFLSRQTVVVK